jgi:hypothetical protein
MTEKPPARWFKCANPKCGEIFYGTPTASVDPAYWFGKCRHCKGTIFIQTSERPVDTRERSSH